MKRIIAAITLMLVLAGSASALEDNEYRRMKEHHQSFAKAEQQLTEAYSKLMGILSVHDCGNIRKSQRAWLDAGRDIAASAYMEEGYPAYKAYTMATNDRVKELTRLYKLYSAKKRK